VRRLLPDPSDDVDLAAAYALPEGRHVRVNFASSADGAVTVSGTSRALSSDADRELFHLLRAMSDVVLVGAGTGRKENYGGARVVDGKAPPIAVVSRSLGLNPAARFFTETTTRPIVITCGASPADQRGELAAVADVVLAGDDDVDLRLAIAALAERGLVHVLCEGGPQLFGSLLSFGLVDELCLSLAPVLAGGTAGRIVVGLDTDVATAATLEHVLEDDGHLFLRYAVPSG
jgi:5-amino-6-(5-phosphoribosylamino)uracil reductase